MDERNQKWYTLYIRHNDQQACLIDRRTHKVVAMRTMWWSTLSDGLFVELVSAVSVFLMADEICMVETFPVRRENRKKVEV